MTTLAYPIKRPRIRKPDFVIRWADRWKRSRVGRTLAWYNVRAGNQYAGGIAYSALFSLLAVLTIGFNIISAVFRDNDVMLTHVVDEVNRLVPRLVGFEEEVYAFSPYDLISDNFWNPASIVSIVVLLVSITNAMTSVRRAVRAMFRTAPLPESPIHERIMSLLGFLVLGVGFVLAAAGDIGSEAIGQQFGGVPRLTIILQYAVALSSIPLDALVAGILIRYVAGVRPEGTREHKDFWRACIATGIVATILRWLGVQIVAMVSGNNVVLAPFIGFVTLLMVVNFLSRALLYACAWLKDPPQLENLADPHDIGINFFD